ncbi:hypothetical protein N7474_004756 [Penicillium riverlandense]|uniref:uncharacterized protein n=1 Tax=Penicillium riverlandense TaxID=1903569 RepID=UPI0025492ADA|nr:uncharacterized protein N7474_004756 [Penicillium riverlandense]KAJ5819165.1 hypothetical protein N7474_004756 [Penicillium riverlandense]
MSVAHGRPRAINFEDVNVAPLCAADFEDCLAGDAESFIHYADICFILGDITESCSRNSLTKAKKEYYQSQIFRWPRVLPTHLRISHLSANNADEYSLCGYDLNTRQLHIPYFISLAILGRPSTRNTISAQGILAASFVAGIFQELLVRDDIGHLAPIFTRYCVASSFFLVSLRSIPELWDACQPDLEVLRLCLKELSKRWKSAIGGSKALESILNTQRHNATPMNKRLLPLTREQHFFFDGFPLELCHMWTPCTTFYQGAAANAGHFTQYAQDHSLIDAAQGRGIEPIVSTAPFTSVDEQEIEVLPLADFLVDGLDNWLSEEASAV